MTEKSVAEGLEEYADWFKIFEEPKLAAEDKRMQKQMRMLALNGVSL